MNPFKKMPEKTTKEANKMVGIVIRLMKETYVQTGSTYHNEPAAVKTHHYVEIAYKYKRPNGEEYTYMSDSYAAVSYENALEIYEEIVNNNGGTRTKETLKETFIPKNE